MSTIFTKSACLSRQRLEGYVQGTLDRPTVREVEHHLNDCPLCSQAVEGMKMLQPSTLSIPKKSTSNKKWLVWLFVLLFAITAILLGNWYMQQRDSIQKIIADYNAQTFAIVQRNSEATASLKTHILNGNYDLAQKSLQTLAPLSKDQPDIQAINWVIQLQTG
ncbi:MAG: zf-HC2 domain-containing protein, partial [Saprospiraceae bacterium]|nr:zf-HC2 domain-containing protein [Saprospiraceae bacterium]